MFSYFLTGLAVCIAGGVHWLKPNNMLPASLISTALIVVTSLLSIYFFQSNYLGLDDSAENNTLHIMLFVAGIVSFFGLLVSLMVGYFLKTVRS